MESPVVNLEGTWDEIEAHADSLRGKRLRVTEAVAGREVPGYRPASGRGILRHARTWSGTDLHECLEEVIADRAKARF